MNKLEKVKTHFDENKKVYVALGIGVTIGAAVTVLTFHNKAEVAQKINQVAVGYKNKQVLVNLVERSTPSTPIHLLGSAQYFDSISDAARRLGVDRTLISKHINGHIPDVHGMKFEVV